MPTRRGRSRRQPFSPLAPLERAVPKSLRSALRRFNHHRQILRRHLCQVSPRSFRVQSSEFVDACFVGLCVLCAWYPYINACFGVQKAKGPSLYRLAFLHASPPLARKHQHNTKLTAMLILNPLT